MTRPDYERIAAAIDRSRVVVSRLPDGSSQLRALETVVRALAWDFSRASERFDRVRFCVACGFASAGTGSPF